MNDTVIINSGVAPIEVFKSLDIERKIIIVIIDESNFTYSEVDWANYYHITDFFEYEFIIF